MIEYKLDAGFGLMLAMREKGEAKAYSTQATQRVLRHAIRTRSERERGDARSKTRTVGAAAPDCASAATLTTTRLLFGVCVRRLG